MPGGRGSGGPAGPARALTSTVNGPFPDATDTSATSPVIAHRTSRASWARATRSARAHPAARPSAQWSAAASAARSAPPAARCLTTTACPRASTMPNTTHSTAIAPTLQTVADPRSEPRARPRPTRRPQSGGRTPLSDAPPPAGRAGRPRPTDHRPQGSPGVPVAVALPHTAARTSRSRRSRVRALMFPPPPSLPRSAPPPRRPPPAGRTAARAAPAAWPRRPHAPVRPRGSP